MRINKSLVAGIIGSIEGTGEVTVSLFIVSSKSPRLKKLDLDPKLSREERAEKLHKYAQQHRFVAVIEMGDKVFAHAHAEHAEKLGRVEDLKIEGKKVTVKALTDAESEELSLVGEAFEDYLLKEEEKSKAPAEFIPQMAVRSFLAEHALIGTPRHMDVVIAALRNVPGQVILNCLRQMSEARREMERQKKEDEKVLDIRDQEIRKAMLKKEVEKQDNKAQSTKKTAIAEDHKHVHRARG